MTHAVWIKGTVSRDYGVLFLVLIDSKSPSNISAEGFQLILVTFSCLILKLKSPSGTSFGLYFAFAEYRTDDSNSPADWYHTSEMFQSYSTVR